jgi:putative nucleotidyltransferase with HDIG domain
VSALRDIDRTLVGSVDLRVTLSGVVSHAMRELGLDAACIVLLDTTMQTLRCAASAGFRTHALQRLEIPARGGLASTLAAGSGLGQGTGPLATQSVFAGRPEFAAEGIVTCFAVPLVVKGDFRGVMEVYLRRPFSPDTDWLDFLGTLGGQVAVAIDSSSLFEHEQRSHNDMLQAYDATIEGWSRALDLRDKETEGHTQRVTRMTIELARALGMTEEQLVHVRRGALLHDIGKLGVPDAILLKPGPLTDEEWVLMKQHPALAHGMLSPIDYLRPALDIPWCHHEKWDGSGYPRGLAGEAIPLSARIFSVVDVWDALRSDRPYRPRWTTERAIEHIRAQSGVDFDPRVAEEFLARELWKLAD